jgi:hypothetical protein
MNGYVPKESKKSQNAVHHEALGALGVQSVTSHPGPGKCARMGRWLGTVLEKNRALRLRPERGWRAALEVCLRSATLARMAASSVPRIASRSRWAAASAVSRSSGGRTSDRGEDDEEEVGSGG